MAEWVLKYADPRGQIHQQTALAATEKELRDRYSQQGFLIYSIKPKGQIAGLPSSIGRERKKLNLEKFLIFNQQFVTLIKAGLPIMKALDLLADRLSDAKLSIYVKSVRDRVHAGSLLSDAFAGQGVFPPIYVTSVLAGERSGALAEVLDRFISYQRMALAVRKKLLLSLVYPSLLITLVLCLVVFLITYVVPSFAELYNSMSAQLPTVTLVLIAIGTTARGYILTGAIAFALAVVAFRYWARTTTGREWVERFRMRLPLAGEIWTKYEVAQFSRILSTLMVGGIPLLQALDTASTSLSTSLLRKALSHTAQMVKEGKSLSSSLNSTKMFPSLAIDMMEVGESTGALPQMLSSVAEFYEEDVNTRMTAALSLIEPAIMIFMGIFVTFVLVALYLPIFSLADSLR